MGENKLDELFDEFESSLSANVIVQGPNEVLDLRGQLLKGCVQCGKRIGEFMLPQDIACALTAGRYALKPEGARLMGQLWIDQKSLRAARIHLDGLVRASGDAATVLKHLKEVDPVKFLQVLVILWRYEKEQKVDRTDTVPESEDASY